MNNLNNEPIQLRSSYDYIVIGAGSAGSIVAAQLSENPNLSVLLLEAGKNAMTVPNVWNPNEINCLYNDSSIDWGYKTIPQIHMKNRILDYSRAKMTGGCTSHNDMVYTRGAPSDFNLWESDFGCAGWDYDSIVHNFKHVEEALGITLTAKNEFAQSFLEACNELGITYNPNYNSGQNMFGVSPLQSTITSQNVRETSFQAYIYPHINRPNLDVYINCQVTTLSFNDENKAVALHMVNGNNEFTIAVNKEIVLSLGAINTPALLMRSGIGNAAMLKSLGAPRIISDLSGVGQNLQEAIIFKGTWSTKLPIYDQPRNEGYFMVWAGMNEYEQPTNCIEMMRGTYQCGESEEELESHYSITGGAMRLKSTGTVTLSSLDYNDKPIIDLNLYANPDDLRQARDAFDLLRAIGNSTVLSPWRDQELVPGPSVTSDEEITNWILENSYPYSHASCTCQMGTGPNSVVDSNLRVKGVTGLRIADISVMPFITSGHTQGPAFMIGDKAAELISCGN